MSNILRFIYMIKQEIKFIKDKKKMINMNYK